jgi:hypothetical protein
MNYQFLCDYQENLENKIQFFLDDSQQFSWDKIYIFSAFVSEYGVDKVKEIISHESLNENTEVVIAIGKKTYDINKPIDIQKILDFVKDQNQNKFKTKPIRFICPKNDGFHIKAYCFLGHNKKGSQTQIGYSIIGSSNLTKFGFKGKGELCISIDNLELTQKLIDCLSDKYIINNRSYNWDQEIEKYKIKYEERQEKKYKDKQSRQDQDEVEPLADRPKDGRSIEWISEFGSHIIDAEGKNLIVQSRESELNFLYYSSKNIYEMEELYPVDSLCHLAYSNDVKESWNKGIKREIIKIKDHKYYSEGEHNGCFLLFKIKLSYNVCDDILDIAKPKKYEEIFNVSDESILPYDTLKMFEEEVKKYQEMLQDDKYKKGLEKAKKMQSKIDILLDEIEEKEEIDLITLKKKLKEIRESI